MAEDQGKEEEKFDFTPEGEAVGYISLDQLEEDTCISACIRLLVFQRTLNTIAIIGSGAGH